MEPDIRAITPKTLPAYQLTDARGFSAPFERGPDDPWSNLDLDRAIGVFDRDEIVGVGRNYSLELTAPGGALLPVAGVSWISVLPTHRRQGILRSMMDRLLRDACEHEEPAMILTASEGGIYGRFGYGIATTVMGIEIERRRVAFRDRAPGRVRMVSPDEALAIAPTIFDRVRRTRPGVVSRPDAWWEGEWWDTRDRAVARFDVVFDGASGPEGFALYGVGGGWSAGESEKTLHVRDLVATTPEATAGLWQYLGTVDLVRTIKAWNVPTDTELRWLLTDARALKATDQRDFLWLRPIDVARLLATRTYAVDGRLVLEVVDEGPASGRYELDGGPDGASCTRTDADPHVVLGADTLGMIALGGVRPSVLVRAGRIHVPVTGAATVADSMFAADREPNALTWF